LSRLAEMFAAIGGAQTNTQLQNRCLKLCREMGLKHTIYAASTVYDDQQDDPLMLLSYPDEWVKHYFASKYQRIDPALILALSSTLPVNWTNISKKRSLVKTFFGEAREMGVGKTGMTVSVYGPTGSSALFSVTSNMSDKEWLAFSPEITSNVVYLSHLVHDRASIINGADAQFEDIPLGLMEKSCLQWIAEGLTMNDVADKLRVSERTVRMHLSSARTKLNSNNTIHAIIKLMRRGQLF